MIIREEQFDSDFLQKKEEAMADKHATPENMKPRFKGIHKRLKPREANQDLPLWVRMILAMTLFGALLSTLWRLGLITL